MHAGLQVVLLDAFQVRQFPESWNLPPERDFGLSTHHCIFAVYARRISRQTKLYMQLDCSSRSASPLEKGGAPAMAAGMPSGKASDLSGGGPLPLRLPKLTFLSLALLAVPQGGAAPMEKTLPSAMSFL